MSHNTWLHFVVRYSVVKPLAKTSISPNQLTTLRVITGVTAFVCMAIGPQWQALGGGFFVLSVLLDRVDGDLARLTKSTSYFGHRYDMISDAVCNSLVLLGLGVGLRDGDFGAWAALMGMLAGASVASILWMVMKMEEASGERTAELPNYFGFDADDAVLLIPIFVWLGFAEGLLATACIIAPLVTVLYFLMYCRHFRSSLS